MRLGFLALKSAKTYLNFDAISIRVALEVQIPAVVPLSKIPYLLEGW